MADDDFEVWLGRTRDNRSFRGAVLRSANLAGGLRRAGARSGGRFTGARIGRGSAVGGLLSSARGKAASRARRVVVKTRIVRLAGQGGKGAIAHLRYLQRDGTTREGERGVLYGPERDDVDGKAFLERGSSDRHQFRFIVAAEDGASYQDLKPLVRRLMTQAELDLDTRLDWVAVDHFNTGHPHSHILVRGKDEGGKDLVIARGYLTHGLRERASELVELDLGPRTAREIAISDAREVAQERFTGIDRRLLRSVDEHGLVAPHHRDGTEQALRAGRLGTLSRMGLAQEVSRGCWKLDAELETTLRAMGRRGDIIAALDHAARTRGLEVSPMDYVIHDPSREAVPVVGRVVERGLADHDEDRSYLIVDGIDGRAHYVDLGTAEQLGEGIAPEAIVRVTPAPAEVREVDRTIVEIAEANDGYYAPGLHAHHDSSASDRFITAHVRRLEALRRLSGVAERDANGLWKIAPDHLDRVLDHERARRIDEPVRVEVLSSVPLERLPRHDGITPLDEDRDLGDARRLGGGFGRKVSDALERRRGWLAEQGLAEQPDALEVLRRRELQRVAAGLSSKLGVDFVKTGDGSVIQGTYRQSVQVGATRMAVIENEREFALVPWRRTLERQLGREVEVLVRGNDISWTFGQRSLGLER